MNRTGDKLPGITVGAGKNKQFFGLWGICGKRRIMPGMLALKRPNSSKRTKDGGGQRKQTETVESNEGLEQFAEEIRCFD